MSVLLALARRGVDALLLEAEPELALAASGTNSGVLHTGLTHRRTRSRRGSCCAPQSCGRK